MTIRVDRVDFLRQLQDLPDLDCLLITQSLDDHCHVKTLTPLSKMLPGLPVISTPNAEAILSKLFKNVSLSTFLGRIKLADMVP